MSPPDLNFPLPHFYIKVSTLHIIYTVFSVPFRTDGDMVEKKAGNE
jgi:hypothetical protein